MIIVAVDDPERAGRILKQLNIPVAIEPDRIVVSPERGIAPSDINALLVRAGIAVSQLLTRHSTLEDVFLDLTAVDAERTEPAPLK